jgi:glycosyltransferase involved in cell wall biosynthesis
MLAPPKVRADRDVDGGEPVTTKASQPLVSILTPAYNSAAYIGETIASVRAQTFRNFELIVADDGSTDATVDMVRRIANRDPRIVVVSSPHGGPATARNAAVAVARGQFFALLDSDDVWMPEYLSEQLAIAHRFPAAGVVTPNGINRGGELDGRPLWPATSGLRTLALHDMLVEDNAVCVMALFRRDVFERSGGFDPRFTGNEDYEFWLRAANAGVGFVQNKRPLCYYRRRAGSLSSDTIRMSEGIIRVLETAATWSGPIERERQVIIAKMAQMRDQMASERLRASLSRRDAQDAAMRLKDLSELRGSVCLAVAARIINVWPQLLVRAYDLRRALRAS